jgi:DNA repair exonuclease SbcCD ATPase subunit
LPQLFFYQKSSPEKMKNYIITLVFLLSALCYTSAQSDPKISEQIRSNSKGSFNALVMELPGKLKSLDLVEKEWKSYIKKYKGKVSYSKKTDEIFSDDAKIKDMSENTVDIICKIVPKNADNFEVVVWYNLGVVYLSSKEFSQGIAAAEVIMKDFSKIVFLNLYKEKLKAEEAVLKGLNKELDKTQKEAKTYERNVKDFESEIVKIQKKIAETKETLNSNKEKQNREKAEISKQEKIIEATKKDVEAAKRKRR